MKVKQLIGTVILILLFVNGFSQSDSLKIRTKKGGSFYISAGFTRAWWGKSDLHLVDRSNKYHEATGLNNNYDFTVYKVEANDRPDFDKLTDIINFTVPQYAYRLGYYFNNKADIGLEINYDHTKYIVQDYQRVHIKGDINGTYIDADTILNPKTLLHFEHSDGANFLLFNFVKRWKFINPSKMFNASWVAKAGVGIVIPRTDVTLFGERFNNDFKIAGWMAGVETGLRVEFFKYAFFEFVGKASYADYVNAFVLGKGNGRASHHVSAYQLTLTLGAQYFLKDKK